jgi:hypothetical protein
LNKKSSRKVSKRKSSTAKAHSHGLEKNVEGTSRTRYGTNRGKSKCAMFIMCNYLWNWGTPTRGMAQRMYACASTSALQSTTGEYVGMDDRSTSTETYDSDSSWIGIDSLSTYCITNSMEDFSRRPMAIKTQIKGINDTPAHVTFVGKGNFKLLDCKGQQHKFEIEKLYYCATKPMKILSPQHLDKMWKEKDSGHRLISSVDSDGCGVLRWIHQNKSFKKFIPIDKRTGVPMFQSSPGYQRMHTYMTGNPGLEKDDQIMCCQSVQVIEDEENSISEHIEEEYPMSYPQMGIEAQLTPKRSNLTIKTPKNWDGPIVIEFGDEDIHATPIADSSTMDPTSEMLFLHYKLGHLSFNKIRQMAHSGLVPRKFLNCRIPRCAACMYGTATKRPWWTKQPPNSIQQGRSIREPG